MSALRPIILTGNSFGDEKSVIELCAGEKRYDGCDVAVTVKVLEFAFHLSTFFFGFNLRTFVDQARAVVAGRAQVASLLNYNQTLRLEFIRLDGKEFVSIRYKSIAPDAPPEHTLAALRRLSSLSSHERTGSAFALTLMKLDTPLEDCAIDFDNMLTQLNLAATNPYEAPSS